MSTRGGRSRGSSVEDGRVWMEGRRGLCRVISVGNVGDGLMPFLRAMRVLRSR